MICVGVFCVPALCQFIHVHRYRVWPDPTCYALLIGKVCAIWNEGKVHVGVPANYVVSSIT